jgi:hypothetical protein
VTWPARRDFFGSVLGLKLGHSRDDKWGEYDVGPATFALSTMMTGTEPGAKEGAAARQTAEFNGAVSPLKARGVKFAIEPTDSGFYWFALRGSQRQSLGVAPPASAVGAPGGNIARQTASHLCRPAE